VFDDVNRTIEALLRAELPADVAGQVGISFATPDETFPPQGLQLPALNLFLYEVRENTQLRDLEAAFERRADGQVTRVAPPVRVDCHYLVSAVAKKQLGSEIEEHHILGATLRALLRHKVLPASVLRGELAGKSPPMRAVAIAPGTHASGLELWQALKGKPRACLHYTLTIPVDTSLPETVGPPVTTLEIGVRK
jgi:hypothetical protein